VIVRLQALAETFLADALDGVSASDQARVRDVLARVRGNFASGARAARRAS